jgi:hypothetical protein
MSLDVTLKLKRETVFDANITHNLGKMASACGVYYACWRPEEINCSKAKHILPMLKDGIEVMKNYPEFYKTFDSSNGWGLYIHFLPWLEKYATACENYPEARISVSR